MNERPTIRVLLVEDDEDDFIITRDILTEIRTRRFEIEWKRNFADGLTAMTTNNQDICLIDYRLGSHDGLELLKAAKAAGAEAPVILLTGQGQEEVDMAAMAAGAADFIVKGSVNGPHLERTIRYAIERKRAASMAAFEQARLAAFCAQVGLELSRRAPLDQQLENCAQAMTQFLNCALAQIWIHDAEQGGFVSCARAGEVPDLPFTTLDFPALAQGRPVYVAALRNQPEFPHQDWAAREQLVSFAAYPLMLEDRAVGCISLFSREPLAETVLQEIGSVANGIAFCIQRRQNEAQVQKLAAFPRVNPNPVLEFSADGNLTYANDAASDLARSLEVHEISDLLPEHTAKLVAECLASGSKKLHEEIIMGGRTLTWSFFPVAESRVVHCYGADITERLSLEAQYRHAQKLESVGQLAAGIAHDFNNLLTVIQGFADMLLVQAKPDGPEAGPLKQISGAARRASTLTRQLLMFSRKQVLQARVLDLNDVLIDMDKMLPRLLSEDIALRTDYAASLPTIEADAGMIEQIVMNLVVNARDAMPKGGQLVVATAIAEVAPTQALRWPNARAGRFVCLSVQDTGSGMDEKTLAQVFEPFFSTKEAGKGSGLGLATVYGIAKQHQGWVEVVSQVGVGSTFKIYFPPTAAAAADLDHSTAVPQSIRGGRETILLVEDEAPVRDMVSQVLRKYDYNVLEASNGVEALKVWEEQKGKVDLLLTDMVMPAGLTGSDLARKLRQLKPGLKVIFSSGFSSEILNEELKDETQFLAKPYAPPVLAQRVRSCLDAPAKNARPSA